jgi:hypothetical protein
LRLAHRSLIYEQLNWELQRWLWHDWPAKLIGMRFGPKTAGTLVSLAVKNVQGWGWYA